MSAFERLATPTIVKLLFAASGLALFGWGIRTESTQWRWYGIALVGVAAALRVWRSGRRSRDS